MQLTNRTACIRAEGFIRQETAKFQTAGLLIWLGHLGRSSLSVRGSFRRRNPRILAMVNPSFALPVTLRFPVLTETHSDGQMQWIHDEELAGTLEELMVWTFFHEFHHYLCYTQQRTLDLETRANAFGFEMMRKFKQGRDVHQHVAKILEPALSPAQ